MVHLDGDWVRAVYQPKGERRVPEANRICDTVPFVRLWPLRLLLREHVLSLLRFQTDGDASHLQPLRDQVARWERDPMNRYEPVPVQQLTAGLDLSGLSAHDVVGSLLDRIYQDRTRFRGYRQGKVLRGTLLLHVLRQQGWMPEGDVQRLLAFSRSEMESLACRAGFGLQDEQVMTDLEARMHLLFEARSLGALEKLQEALRAAA